MKTFNLGKLTFTDLKKFEFTWMSPERAGAELMRVLEVARAEGIDLSFIGEEVPEYDELDGLALAYDVQNQFQVALLLRWLKACYGGTENIQAFVNELKAFSRRLAFDHNAWYPKWIAWIERHWQFRATARPEPVLPDEQKTMSIEEALRQLGDDDDDDDDGVVVLKDIGNGGAREDSSIAKLYGKYAGKKFLLHRVEKPVEEIAEHLSARFPWATSAVEALVGDIATKIRFGDPKLSGCLRPILLVGPAGCGKTTMLTEVASLLGLPASLMPCGGLNDSGGFLAVARGWATARPCGPFERIVSEKIANPVLILDEIEKAGSIGDNRNGSIHGALLGMMNDNGRYFDSCLLANVDLSYVNFWATANSLDAMPEPLLDRFNVIEVPAPGASHARAIVDGVITAEAQALNTTKDKLPKPSLMELEEFERKLTGQGGSIRAVQRAYRAWLAKKALPKKDPDLKAVMGQVIMPSTAMH